MSFLRYKLVNSSLRSFPSVVHEDKMTYKFLYPCDSLSNCTNYEIILYPGEYFIELYGASGGGMHHTLYRTRLVNQRSFLGICPTQNGSFESNVRCSNMPSAPGSGGYISGYITLYHKTRAFLAIGGSGTYIEDEGRNDGGYNGGGSSELEGYGSKSSGGGATDLRFDKDDLYHRVLVAGGGGGCDHYDGEHYPNDLGINGSGGAGGGTEAQGFFSSNKENKNYTASQSSGFSFGFGESAIESGSRHPNGVQTVKYGEGYGAGGGGWFGGFSSFDGDGGGGGGSSYALTEKSWIPNSQIQIYNSTYDLISQGEYAFRDKKNYLFTDVLHAKGVWAGNGFARFTYIKKLYTHRFNSMIKANKKRLLVLF